MSRLSSRVVQALTGVCSIALLVSTAGCTKPRETVDPKDVAAKIAAEIRAEFDRDGRNFYRNVRAILVYVRGRPVLEQYYQSSATVTRNVFSVTKSVMATLIGIAVSEGKIRSVDQTLAELLPSHVSGMKAPVPSITLRQVLTMTAGFPGDSPDTLVENPPDWVRTTLSTGAVSPPGTEFSYASNGSHLLSAILVQATGQSVLEYARAKLFDPLGIQSRPAFELLAVEGNIPAYQQAQFAWPVDPQGHHIGFSFLKVTPNDMAKLGNLYLDEGRWQGKQLLPAAWIRESTTAHQTSRGISTGYGYQWWVTDARGYRAFCARGYGGQLIEIVPERHLVVVGSTDVNENDPGSTIDSGALETIVSTFIVPAIAPLL